jgi:hypothetical protein
MTNPPALIKLNTDGPPYRYGIQIPKLMLTFQLNGCCSDCDKEALRVVDELMLVLEENAWRLELSSKNLIHG